MGKDRPSKAPRATAGTGASGSPRGPRRAVVPPELEGPLDRAVRTCFQVSWGRARGWVEGGKIRVGGAVVRDPLLRVVRGGEIELDEAARRVVEVDLDDGAVVFADAQVVVVAKPAGVSTVPYDEDETGTLDERVRSWLGRRGLAARGTRPNLGVVHRIDKETTGLVVFTRTWAAKQSLTSQFRAHTVHRRYLALAHGDVRSAVFRSLLVADRGDGLRGLDSRSQAGGKAPVGHRSKRTLPGRRSLTSSGSRGCAERPSSGAASRPGAPTRSAST